MQSEARSVVPDFPLKFAVLLTQARSLAPAIIFIDEIDAVGRTRGGAQGNDERDQTLNQMLSEMDGFQNSSQVIVMAATNRQVPDTPLKASAQCGKGLS